MDRLARLRGHDGRDPRRRACRGCDAAAPRRAAGQRPRDGDPPRARLGGPVRRDDGRSIRIALVTGVPRRRPERSSRCSSRSRRHCRSRRWRAADWDVADAWPFLLAGPARAGDRADSSSRSPCATPARRARRSTVGTAPLFAVATALVFLDEPLVAGLILGACSDRHRRHRSSPAIARGRSTSSASGSSTRSSATIAFATRDNRDPLARDRRRPTPSRAWQRSSRCSPATAVSLAFVAWTRRRSAAAPRIAFVPAGRLLRPVVRLPVRGVLPRPRVRRLADRRHRVAVGRDARRGSCCGSPSGWVRGSSRARRSSSPAAC